MSNEYNIHQSNNTNDKQVSIEDIRYNNLNLLAGAVEEENNTDMARQRSMATESGGEGGLQHRKLPVDNISNGVTIRNKSSRAGGIYNPALMPDLTQTQCSITKNRVCDELIDKEINLDTKTNNRLLKSNIDTSDDEEENHPGNDNNNYHNDINENDDNSNINSNRTPKPRNFINNTLLPSPLENLSHNESSDITSTSTNKEDYMSHCESNGFKSKYVGESLRKRIEKIIKYYTWSEYKLPDKFNFRYMSDFSKIILKQIDKSYEHVTIDSQQMWDKAIPMIKHEYQIIRSTITQSMKQVFFGKYYKYCIIINSIKLKNI
jgi:hypothetical protein